MSFYDNDNWLHAQPNVFNAENSIEFTIIDAILKRCPFLFGDVLDRAKYYCLTAERKLVNTKLKVSHDNLTACYALAHLVDSDSLLAFCKVLNEEELNSWHPREWAFYKLIEGKGFAPLNYFSLSIVMIWSCLRKYKYRTYGNGQKVKLIATDGKILCWLRFKSGINMPITKKVCDYLIKKNFGSWKKVFEIYFMPEHPILKHEEKEFNL